jgi:hypothetical protein
MQRNLAGTTSAGQQTTGPSLKETLDWLNEKIPLAVVHYVASVFLNGKRIMSTESEQGTARSFESCTVGFGRVEYAHGDRREDVFDSTTLYTVPLGALTNWRVERVETVQPDDLSKKNSRTFVGGDRWQYDVILRSNLAELSRKTSHSFTPLFEIESVKVVWVSFNDQSLARRVARAFHHASDLCRKKEAF